MMLAASIQAFPKAPVPVVVPPKMFWSFNEWSQRNSRRLITFFHRSYWTVPVMARMSA